MSDLKLEPKVGVRGATIILRSGQYFDFLNPNPEMIEIEDIAWGLSNVCRFAGQSLHYYSVAQHSILVSEILPAPLKLHGLLHDAAEAYVGDMVGPLKQLLPEYKVIEKRVEAAVFQRFGLSMPMPAEIKHADLRLLRTEQRDLTNSAGDDWNGLNEYRPLQQTITPMTPKEAHDEFLYRFRMLTKFRRAA